MQKSTIGINSNENIIFPVSHLLKQKQNVIVLGKPGNVAKLYYKNTKN
ncbi:hypothetical protein [Bacillus cereus]|nr:hypothetical protein [Bacillus cereus]